MRLRITLLITALCSTLFAVSQPLSGTYIIGTASAAPYKTITTAVAKLQAVGMSGPVTFLLNDASYTNASGEAFPITISPITGSSPANTFTIKPNIGKTVAITASNVNNYTAVASIIKINGARNIIIDGSNVANGVTRNLSLINNNTTDYVQRSVFWVGSNGTIGASNVHLKNATLQFSTRNLVSQLLTGVFIGSNAVGDASALAGTAATAINSNISITNNLFTNMRQGVYVVGNAGATLKSTQINIVGNSIGSTTEATKPSVGIFMSYVDSFNVTDNILSGITTGGGGNPWNTALLSENASNFNIKRNTISNVTSSVGYVIPQAIHVKGTQTNGYISENKIFNIKGTNGSTVNVLVVEATATVPSNLIISNNFINDFATTNGDIANGIYIASGTNIKLYHNTVSYSGAINNNSSALYVQAGSQLDIRNNIFSNTGTLGSRYAIYSVVPATAYTQINYNNYYSTPTLGYLGNTRTTIAQWRLATTKDANSISVNPIFTSTTDLHLTTANTGINNLGTPLAGINSDIDGATRSSVFPDMGADEFGASTCATSTTWNGTAWSNGVPTGNTNAIFTGNYIGATDLNACSVNVSNNANVVMQDGKNVNLNGGIAIAAGSSFTLGSSGNLLQPTGAANSGSISVRRKSAAVKRLDYTMWSSPVAGQILQSFSPGTATNRHYTYNSATNVFDEIASPSTTTFAAAKGYLIRASNVHPTVPTVWEGTFTGTLNNGNYTVPVTPFTFNAVGNPYPSAIDADFFISANNLTSPLYFWRKTNGSGTSAYATYTLAGGTGTGPSGIVNPAPGASLVPNGIIPVGQGFITKSANTSLVFNNTMRTTDNSGLLLRSSDERHRIWLNLTNNETDATFSQTLIAYMDGASAGIDAGIDGLYINDSQTALTSIIAEEEYAVQGKFPFEVSDVVPLGFKTTVAGTYTISIDHVDGLFGNDQQVYLRDNLLNTEHNLSSTAYSFESGPGVFNSRFEVIYQLSQLSINTPIADSSSLKIYNPDNSIIVDAGMLQIKTVRLFDIVGKLVSAGSEINSGIAVINRDRENQVLIIQIVMENGAIVNKKIRH
ncbi:MAG TPA: hypothetical protein VF581_03710 [Flavobacterium sp.]|jgi:hypothetical protein